jgi:hypothetical protein
VSGELRDRVFYRLRRAMGAREDTR